MNRLLDRLPEFQMMACAALGVLFFVSVIFRALGVIR